MTFVAKGENGSLNLRGPQGGQELKKSNKGGKNLDSCRLYQQPWINATYCMPKNWRHKTGAK